VKKGIIIIAVLFVVATLRVSFSQETPPKVSDSPEIQSVDEMEHAQQKADLDAQKAKQEAREKEAEILHEQGKLTAKVAEMEKAKKAKEKLLDSLNAQYQKNDKEIERLQKRLDEQRGEMNEIAGSVRGTAQDLRTTLHQSIVSGVTPDRHQGLDPLLSETEFPSLENIKKMSELIFDEITRNGKIATKSLSFVDATGRETQGEVTRIGAFNALFHKEGKVGYLEYSPSKQAFHELTVSPPGTMVREAKKFIKNKTLGLFIDLSAGGAFRQLTERPTWYEELKSGGILIYPIVGLGLIALILIIERFLILLRESRDSESFSKEITPLLKRGEWDAASRVCSRKNGGSLAQVLQAGISHRHEQSEVLESVMEEAIQSSLPSLERNMSALQILGMVSPLLGLLGTVTGMIATFQMITLYGTGDPKIMSGGISEALVTTEYGLIVAIPIILAHGFLQGRIDRIIGTLEEKAIALVNTVKKSAQEASLI
jgi:biopolymer transport protein ExbB